MLFYFPESPPPSRSHSSLSFIFFFKMAASKFFESCHILAEMPRIPRTGLPAVRDFQIAKEEMVLTQEDRVFRGYFDRNPRNRGNWHPRETLDRFYAVL